MKRHTIIGLNSLRFLCFLVIFINHATAYLQYGYLAVDFFFSLSGFLLTLLALEEIKTTGDLNRPAFFVRRLLRIWPLYFLVICFSFFALPVIAARLGFSLTLPEQKIFYWLFLSNYYYHDHLFALKQLWSIAVEEQFYILFLFLSFFFAKHLWKLVIVLCTAYLLILVYAQYRDISLFGNTIYHMISFATGMAVAKIASQNKFPKTWQTALIAVIAFASTLLIVNDTTYRMLLKIPFCIFAGSLLLLVYQSQELLVKNRRLLIISEQLGKYTYGLYIYSGFVISMNLELIPIQQPLLNFFTKLALTILVAACSYHFFERPFLKLKDRFRKIKSTATL